MKIRFQWIKSHNFKLKGLLLSLTHIRLDFNIGVWEDYDGELDSILDFTILLFGFGVSASLSQSEYWRGFDVQLHALGQRWGVSVGSS